MKRALRFLSLAGALGAASLGLTACDASPYAVVVGGQKLTVNSFNHQLNEFNSNAKFVSDLTQQAAQGGGSGNPLLGTGGTGTFNTTFASVVMNLDISTFAVRQHLLALGQLPTQDEIIAVRAEFESNPNFDYWSQLSTPLQDLFLEQAADVDSLAQVPTDPSSLLQAYQGIEPYLFSQLCLDVASVPDLQSAKALASTGIVSGGGECFDQVKLEGQSAAFQKAVLSLTQIGQISDPVPTPYGYQVLQLVTKTTPGFNTDVQKVLAAATSPPDVTGIIRSAKVKVNPMYGSWNPSGGCVIPPKQTACPQ